MNFYIFWVYEVQLWTDLVEKYPERGERHQKGKGLLCIAEVLKKVEQI